MNKLYFSLNIALRCASLGEFQVQLYWKIVESQLLVIKHILCCVSEAQISRRGHRAGAVTHCSGILPNVLTVVSCDTFCCCTAAEA